MKVLVKLEDGTEMVLEVKGSDTVFSVKDKIPDTEVLLRMEEQILSTIWSTEAWGYFQADKVLYFKDQRLEDFRVLEDYEIEDNETLHLRIHFSIAKVASNMMYRNHKKPELITVFVVLPNGKRMAVEADRTRPVFFIAKRIPDSELVPTGRQMMKPMIPEMKTNVRINVYFRKYLCLDGQVLSDGDTLEEYNIKNNDVLHVNVDVSWKMVETERQVNYQRDHQPSANHPKPADLPKTANHPKPATSVRSSKCVVM